MVLRIGYVREHFSSPLLQYASADEGKTFTLVECPSGTGQLIDKITNDEIDIAIALTDPLISAIAKGSKAYKLVGKFVDTPLNWAVTTGKTSRYTQMSDLKGSTIGISRPGSGSQTMAYVMGLQQGWSVDDIKFQVNNDIDGLVKSVNDDTTSAFMWEYFTTKPWETSGQVRFIGFVPTPWPSWLIAASPNAPQPEVRTFLAGLTTYVRKFDAVDQREVANVEFIKEKFGYPEEDIRAWLKTVGYPQDCAVIPAKLITECLSVLELAAVIQKGAYIVENFVDQDVVKLT